MMNQSVGILLINIGTPKAATTSAVRLYLKKFLSDSHVVRLPKIIWWPILYGIILSLRSKKSARLYQTIWTNEGSPLFIHSQKIAEKLQTGLQIPVELGMQYSDPSILQALNNLQMKKVNTIIVLPLYPQYSTTTTASALDTVLQTCQKRHHFLEIKTISDYSCKPSYIQAICRSIQTTWKTRGKKYLLFSFHGIPKRYVKAGDPYFEHCQRTARLVADALQLQAREWSIAFQSRVGFAKWLTPYTHEVLQTLPQKGIHDLHVICPGFAVDCLETLEEIAIRGKDQFLKAGGKSFYYIPALNDSDEHIAMLKEITQLHK